MTIEDSLNALDLIFEFQNKNEKQYSRNVFNL